MLDMVYTIIIYPLYQIIEFAYRLFFELCNNTGIAVIGVSIAVTLLCLPLYAVAECWQEKERCVQKKLKSGIDRIKSVFKGDEQYMILSTFYRQNNYHPMMALRSSFGLLIQIPFFIAAYQFLSSNQELSGKSFLFIRDMGLPDSLCSVFGFSLNVLPITMTFINIIAGAIYTKGFPVKEKIQIYGMALVFLALLYNSPSGLVLYWTMNNVFSLVKNIFYKLKNPIKVFWLLLCGCFVGLLAYLCFFSGIRFYKIIPVICVTLIVFAAPVLSRFFRYLLNSFFVSFVSDRKKCLLCFLLSAFSLAVLAGIVIPSFLVTSSIAEYSYIDSYTNPLYFLLNSFQQALGLFVFWPVCVYFLFGRKIQTGISVLFFIAVLWALINAFAFQGDYGVVSPELVFTEHKSFDPSFFEFSLNVLILLAVGIVALFLYKWNKISVIRTLAVLICLSLVVLATVNSIRIGYEFSMIGKKEAYISDFQPILHLTKSGQKKGKNVIVFMLDKAPGYLLEEVFSECPELYEQFSGFSFYPNTVSFGRWTVQGAPPLYGGYEYSPWEMNQRRDVSMVDKHNEALALMPIIFEQAGFICDVLDPPYPNYDTPPIFKIFDGHENIKPTLAIGRYSERWYKENNYPQLPIKSTLIKRNFIWFSMFKMVPVALRSSVHYKNWWTPDSAVESKSDFIDRYSILDYMPELTDIDAESNSFILIDNETSHNIAFCQAPDFVPIEVVTNYGRSIFSDDSGYHSVAAALKRIGEWFNFLKANDVYDNTRIIIVSDHGSYHRVPAFEDSSPMLYSFEYFNPLLMVKDFNETGKLRIDNAYMTNADTPAIAFEGIVANPTNPFTGNKIRTLSLREKNERSIVSCSRANGVRSTENNGFKIRDADWYSVHDNVFMKSNWKQLYPKGKGN